MTTGSAFNYRHKNVISQKPAGKKKNSGGRCHKSKIELNSNRLYINALDTDQ